MGHGETPEYDYIDNSTVSKESRKLVVPQGVYERGVLTHPEEIDKDADSDIGLAHWSYDTATGWVILSDRPLSNDIKITEGKLIEGGLEKAKYRTPKHRKQSYTQQGEKANWTLTIPPTFFDMSDPGEEPSGNTVPEAVRFKDGEFRHFVTAEEFLSDEPNEVKACFVLKSHQLNNIINGHVPDDVGGGWTPQFI